LLFCFGAFPVRTLQTFEIVKHQNPRDAPQGHRKGPGQISEPHKQGTICWPEHDEEGEIQKMKKPNSVEQLLAAQSELLKDMFIAELAIAGVAQRDIAKVVRIDLNRVTRIAKSLKRRKNGDS